MTRSLAAGIGMVLLAVAPSLRGAEPAGEMPTRQPLRLLESRHEAVRFDGWEDDGSLVFHIAEGSPNAQELRSDRREIVRFGRGAAARGGQGLLLVDGSFLAGRVARITATECVLSGRYFEASVPRPLVRAVLLTAAPIDGLQHQIMSDAFSATGGDDIAIGVDADRTLGTLQEQSSGDSVVWDRGSDTLTMAQGERRVQLTASRIRALIFSPLLTPLFGAEADAMTVGLADGTRMQVQRTRTAERTAPLPAGPRGETEAVRWELACGAVIAVPARRWSPAVVRYLSPRRIEGAAQSATVKRLSDEPPLRMRVQPMFGSARDVAPAERDQSPDTGVRVGGYWYGNAVIMPSGAQAVYRGVAAGGSFRADVAVRDPDAPDAAAGSVRFRVLIVGEAGKLREVWQSETVRGGQAPVTVDVPLPPTPALVLVVDAGDRGGAGDRAAWIDAIVTSR